jgi:hypothetical protein
VFQRHKASYPPPVRDCTQVAEFVVVTYWCSGAMGSCTNTVVRQYQSQVIFVSPLAPTSTMPFRENLRFNKFSGECIGSILSSPDNRPFKSLFGFVDVPFRRAEVPENTLLGQKVLL